MDDQNADYSVDGFGGADLEHGEISYAAFGARFFAYAVTSERIASRLAKLDGEVITYGPRPLASVAHVSASGTIGTASVHQTGNDPLTFQAVIPVSFDVIIRVAGAPQHFHADVRIMLMLRVCAYDTLRVFLHVRTPRADDVQVDLEARNWGASVLNAMLTIEHELRRVVAQQVQVRLDAPEIRTMREFDVAAYIDAALAD